MPLLAILVYFIKTIPRRKTGFCNQSIYDYLGQFAIYNYNWLFIQLLFTFGCAYNYLATNVFFIIPFEQLLTWFSSKKTHLCSINCKCSQMNYNPCAFKVYFAYSRVYEFIMVYNMYPT
jgi:hypothetical protein